MINLKLSVLKLTNYIKLTALSFPITQDLFSLFDSLLMLKDLSKFSPFCFLLLVLLYNFSYCCCFSTLALLIVMSKYIFFLYLRFVFFTIDVNWQRNFTQYLVSNSGPTFYQILRRQCSIKMWHRDSYQNKLIDVKMIIRLCSCSICNSMFSHLN